MKNNIEQEILNNEESSKENKKMANKVLLTIIIFIGIIFLFFIPLISHQYFGFLISGSGESATIPKDNIGFTYLKKPIINIFQSPNPKDSLSLKIEVIDSNGGKFIDTTLYELGSGISLFPTSNEIKDNATIKYSLIYGNKVIDSGERMQEVKP